MGRVRPVGWVRVAADFKEERGCARGPGPEETQLPPAVERRVRTQRGLRCGIVEAEQTAQIQRGERHSGVVHWNPLDNSEGPGDRGSGSTPLWKGDKAHKPCSGASLS
ncbi:hypothetical protein NDU88_005060 [Pleurodeles waltl]|uniref:Uncharacterized protein n=1 Tax=Pleurodeles waltl TaxID=8319 RepID=A0AAV7SKQ4_PLEWA|nr:hypothetical protein NDU88_005060 [Pleurodeles waltl]